MKRREREEKTKAFWEKKDLSIRSMLLNDDAEEIDRLERPEILSYLPSWEGKSVLDLPCGTGRFTSEFAPRASRVVAVDLCSHFLQQSRQVNKSYRNIEYLQSDAMDLSFPDASFDLIFMSWLLQYLEDTEIEAFASRLAAWLKPGGSLFIRESCWPQRGVSPNPSYFAIYRSLPEYPRFFEGKLPLLTEGNIKAYEDLQSDPFKSFWVFGRD